MSDDQPVDLEVPKVVPRKPRRRNGPVGVNGGSQHATRSLDDGRVKLRDKQILAMRVAQVPIKEIQAKFGISRQTVYRSLTMAQRRAFQDHAIDRIAEELLPKALAAFDLALDQGNVEVAGKIFEGLGILGKNVNVQLAPAAGGTETIEEFRARIIRRTSGPDPDTSDPVDHLSVKTDDPGTIEVTAIPDALEGSAVEDGPEKVAAGGIPISDGVVLSTETE